MRLYELIVEDENVDGIFAISLVHDPAIESNGVFFDKERLMFAEVSKEERLFMSPVLIPNKYILRVDAEGVPYHVFFKPETVKRLSQMYLENKYTDKATLEHEKPIDGVSLVESWIVESGEKDKSKLYGLSVPTGTWMGTFRITNDKIWEDYVKTGKVRGFSIEGLFEHKLSEPINKGDLLFSKEVSELTEEEAEVVLSAIQNIINLESYSDYGDGIRNNAKRGIELNEKNGNKCATQTGKVRAQQLANGEPISVETIKRMYSYLSRAETYYDESDTSSCGTISYLLWGGKAALGWSRNKLRELGLLEENELPSITSTYPGEVASGSISPSLLESEGEIDIFGYGTKQFYICPGAIGTFEDLKQTQGINEDTIGMIRTAAQLADNVFKIEKDAIANQSVTQKEVDEATVIVADFQDLMSEIEIEVGKDYDTSYMDGHIVTIKSYL